MNSHPRLLLLQGSLGEPPAPFAASGDYGPTYGNRLAFAPAWRERWPRHDTSPGPLPAAANDGTDAARACACG